MPPRDSKPLDLNLGTLYIAQEGEAPLPIDGIQEVTLDSEGEPMEPCIVKPETLESATFTGTIELTEEASEKLRQLAATVEALWPVIKQALESVKEMMDFCPNRRVVHLAIRHGDPLVRKKNLKRIERYYKKMRGD